MVLYQCDICGGVCLENQAVLLTIQTNSRTFLLDLCPACFNAKFSKVKLRESKLFTYENDDGGDDDEESFRV